MFQLTIKVIKELYEKHLRNESFKNSIERYIGKEKWLHASSAGHCYRKQAYKKVGQESEPPDFKSMMKMRIGDLIHKDIQEAINKYNTENIILTEGNITLPEYNVRGYYDIIEILDKEINLIDIKTIGSWPWRKKFGLEKNREKHPSKKYELQLGTYALGLIKKYDKKIATMKLLYYKKDDSNLKEIVIPQEYIEKATKYWEKVKELCSSPKPKWDEMIPGEHLGIPFESWECKFCQYKTSCPSPFRENNNG